MHSFIESIQFSHLFKDFSLCLLWLILKFFIICLLLHLFLLIAMVKISIILLMFLVFMLSMNHYSFYAHNFSGFDSSFIINPFLNDPTDHLTGSIDPLHNKIGALVYFYRIKFFLIYIILYNQYGTIFYNGEILFTYC